MATRYYCDCCGQHKQTVKKISVCTVRSYPSGPPRKQIDFCPECEHELDVRRARAEYEYLKEMGSSEIS